MKGRLVMGIFVPKCSQKRGKLNISTFNEEGESPCRLSHFDDWGHQNSSFTVSKTVVSIT